MDAHDFLAATFHLINSLIAGRLHAEIMGPNIEERVLLAMRCPEQKIRFSGPDPGNRLWARELKAELAVLTWAPDGRRLIFGTKAGEVLLYSTDGQELSRRRLAAAVQAQHLLHTLSQDVIHALPLQGPRHQNCKRLLHPTGELHSKSVTGHIEESVSAT